MMKRDSKPTADTFNAGRASIARQLLAHPLASFIGHPGADRTAEQRQAELRRIAAGDTTAGGWSFLSVEFYRAGTSCSLSIQTDWDYSDREPMPTDEAGNEYSKCTLRFEFNHPTHGSVDPASAVARMAFYGEVAMLAAQLHAEHGDDSYWKLHRTPEQKAEHEAKEKERTEKAAIAHAVSLTRGGMRVNGHATVDPVVSKDMAAGTFFHETTDGKRFQLTVAEAHGGNVASVKRLA